jgi:hypothetical protein
VQAERAALLVLGDRLDHRPEDVRVDLGPVEIADMEEIGTRDPAEARHLQAARKQPAIHIREPVGPGPESRGGAVLDLRVHGPENRADHLVGVGRVPRAHLLDRGGEQAGAVEDAGVLGEEAEDEPRHEVLHVVAALDRAPFGIVLQQPDIEPVQPAGCPDIEGAFADLLDGRDAGERQEETEMVREVGIDAGDGVAARQVLGLEGLPIRRQDELCLGPGRSRAGLQGGQRLDDPAGGGNGDMDVVRLEDAP